MIYHYLCSLCVCVLFYSMSAIDFYCSVDKIKGVDGNDRVVVTLDGKYLSHSEQVSVFMISSTLWMNVFTMF